MTHSPPFDGENTLSPEARAEGGGSTHLSEAARSVVLAGVMRGDSNLVINAALIAGKHLRRGQALSYRTLRGYRNDPRARVEIHRLTEEAIQAGHVALSETIVRATESFRACVSDLFHENGSHRQLPVAQRNSLVREMYLAMGHLWACLGREELLQNALHAQEEADGTEQKAGMSPEERLSMENCIKRGILEVLRSLEPDAADSDDDVVSAIGN